jgi:hypothetical protein
MERVQFQQEQMLPELKDLQDKKVFTKVGRRFRSFSDQSSAVLTENCAG